MFNNRCMIGLVLEFFDTHEAWFIQSGNATFENWCFSMFYKQTKTALKRNEYIVFSRGFLLFIKQYTTHVMRIPQQKLIQPKFIILSIICKFYYFLMFIQPFRDKLNHNKTPIISINIEQLFSIHLPILICMIHTQWHSHTGLFTSNYAFRFLKNRIVL